MRTPVFGSLTPQKYKFYVVIKVKISYYHSKNTFFSVKFWSAFGEILLYQHVNSNQNHNRKKRHDAQTVPL